MQDKIPEIALTGGPCSGKTTAKAYLSEKLQDKSYRAFFPPESATMIITGGVHDLARILREEPKKYFEIEKQMLLLQLDLRRRFNELAKAFPEEKRVVICDRGAMDVAAYLSEEQFGALLEDTRLTIFDVRDSYDAAIHLVTAAKGAEKFYTLDNNPARQEVSLEAARLADERTLEVWTGHPHLIIIDNSTGFEQKMKRLLAAVCRVIGIPVPLEIERRFLLSRNPDLASAGIKIQRTLIEQVYLESKPPSKELVRIRKRSQGDHSVYYRTVKTAAPENLTGNHMAKIRQEKESFISAAEYLNLKKLQDPWTNTIVKNRYCFAYNNQYFELDEFLKPERLCGLWLLEIELTEENDRLELPPFFNISREVTDDDRYSNFSLAQRP